MPIASRKRLNDAAVKRKRRCNTDRENLDDTSATEQSLSPISSPEDSHGESFDERTIPTEAQNLERESVGIIRSSSPVESLPTPLLLQDWFNSLNNGGYSFRMNDNGIGGSVLLNRQNGVEERPSGTWILNSENEVIGGSLHRRAELGFNSEMPSPIKKDDNLSENQDLIDNYTDFIASEDECCEGLEDPPITSDGFKPSFNSTIEINASDIEADMFHFGLTDRPSSYDSMVVEGSSDVFLTPKKNAAVNDGRRNLAQETDGPFQLTKMVEELSEMMNGPKHNRVQTFSQRNDLLSSEKQLNEDKRKLDTEMKTGRQYESEWPCICNSRVDKSNAINSRHQFSETGKKLMAAPGSGRNPNAIFAKLLIVSPIRSDEAKRKQPSPKKPPARVLFPEALATKTEGLMTS